MDAGLVATDFQLKEVALQNLVVSPLGAEVKGSRRDALIPFKEGPTRSHVEQTDRLSFGQGELRLKAVSQRAVRLGR